MTDLVKRMTKGTLSKDFFSAFIYCSHIVTTPLELWTIMKSRYYVPKDKEEFKQVLLQLWAIVCFCLFYLLCFFFYSPAAISRKTESYFPVEDDASACGALVAGLAQG
jgi:hypothetical protein